jgi:Tfp pilus assembly protein PilX
MCHCLTKKIFSKDNQGGMTLVITLLLILTLTIMASAVTFVVNSHADLAGAVTHKPLSIESADACIEQAIAWVQTAEGKTWLAGTPVTEIDAAGYGVGAVKNIAISGASLHGKTLKDDTAKAAGDSRSEKFKSRIDKAACTSVQLTVIKKIGGVLPSSGVGGEIGSDAYGSEEVTPTETAAAKYEILAVAKGIFNVATNADGTEIDKDKWAINSSQSNIEVLFSYQE